MKDFEMQHDPIPDPELGAALRALGQEPPMEEVDWQAMRRAIHARAELPLARRRRHAAPTPRPVAPPARSTLRWLAPLLPLAAAASIALAVWPGGEPAGDSLAVQEEAAVAPVNAEEVFHADVSEQEFRLLVSGRSNAEDLLWLAVDEG